MTLTQTFKVDRFNIRPKLIASFLIVALLVGATGALGYQSVAELDHEAHVIGTEGQNMDHAAEMLVGIEQQQNAVLAAQLGDSEARDAYEAANEHFAAEAKAMEPTGEAVAQLEALQATHAEYNQLGTDYFAAMDAGNEELAAQKLAAMSSLRVEMEAQAHTLESMAQAT